jgi:putative inorganic carbon (HCO3(-)) transporter
MSAHNRIESWGEGLQMFRSRPLFGVGFGRYTDFNFLVAHNSFVHTLAETGLFGAFCFVGMGYWFFQRPPQPLDASPGLVQLRAWADDLRHGGLGLAVCALFLSRQYTVVPFIWLAMSGSCTHLLQDVAPAAATRMAGHLARIGMLTIAAIVGTYVIVRALSGAGA